MEISLHELDSDVGIEILSGDDVDHQNLLYLVSVIANHAMSDASAAVMADYAELIETKVRHDVHAVLSHGALGHAGVIWKVRGLGGVAIAAMVGHDHRVVLHEFRGHQVPGAKRIRRAVHQ